MDLPQVITAVTPINNVSGLGTFPIRVTSNNHGLSQNEQPQVRISGVNGNTAANGDFFVTVPNLPGGYCPRPRSKQLRSDRTGC